MIIDPYVDPETGVLKNRLNIKNEEELKQAEADIVLPKIMTAKFLSTKKYDSEFYKRIHKHLFSDIYFWAGQYRYTPLYKEEIVIPGLSVEYTQPKMIGKELDKQLDILNNIDWDSMDIDNKAFAFSVLLSKVWRVHPFREGNTRTALTFASIFARDHNFPLDLSYLVDNLDRIEDENGKVTQHSIRDKLVLASLDDKDYPEPQHLYLVMKAAIEKGKNKRKTKKIAKDDSREDNER